MQAARAAPCPPTIGHLRLRKLPALPPKWWRATTSIQAGSCLRLALARPAAAHRYRLEPAVCARRAARRRSRG